MFNAVSGRARESSHQDVELALKRYCVPAVYQEYQLGNDSEKKAFREGFCGSLDGFVSNAIFCMVPTDGLGGKNSSEAEMESAIQASMKKKSPGSTPETDRLLAKLIQDRGLNDMFGLPILDTVKVMVARWGAPQPFPPLVRHAQYRAQNYNNLMSELKAQRGMNLSAEDTRREFEVTNSSVRKATVTGSGTNVTTDFSSLKPINVKDLRLFTTKKNSVLVGKILCPPMLLTAVQFVLADSTNQQINVSLYNCLPPHIVSALKKSKYDAAMLVEKHFSAGSIIKIANPFFKLGADGSRTIRVDDPRDIKVESASSSSNSGSGVGSSSISVIDAKNDGNIAFKQGNWESARALYKNAFGSEELDVQIALLSNRALMNIKEGNFLEALMDSTTVLILRPKHEKAWTRYCLALKGLGFSIVGKEAIEVGGVPETALSSSTFSADSADPSTKDKIHKVSFTEEMHEIIQALVEKISVDVSDENFDTSTSKQQDTVNKIEVDTFSSTQAEQLKTDGNKLFKDAQFSDAKHLFSEALLVLGANGSDRPLSAILANLAASCLKCGRNIEAFSVSLSALRLFVPAKKGDSSENIRMLPSASQMKLRNKCLARLTTSLVHLGEFGLAEKLYGAFKKSDFFSDETFRDDVESTVANNFFGRVLMRNVNQSKTPDSIQIYPHLFERIELRCSKKNIDFDWVSPDIEVRFAGKFKGRGVFAKTALSRGSIVMVCKAEPTLHAISSLGGVKDGSGATADHVNFMESDMGKLVLPNQREVHRQMIARITDDVAFAGRLLELYDDSADFYEKWEQEEDINARDLGDSLDKTKTKTKNDQFERVLDRFSSFVLPGLPPAPEFATKDAKRKTGKLTEERVKNVLNINCFGTRGAEKQKDQRRKMEDVIRDDTTSLHIPVSLFNHSRLDPTVEFVTGSGEIVRGDIPTCIQLTRDVQAGEELCIRYTDCPEVEKKWIGGSSKSSLGGA